MRAFTARLSTALALLALATPALAKREHGKHHDEPAAVGDGPVESKTGYALTVMCSPAGADVLVDGEKVGVAPMDKPVSVTAGDHTIKVTRLGYAPFLDTFSTKKKNLVKLEVELVPVSGVLHVKSNVAGARVLIDGRFVGEAPVDVEIDVGARAIQVEKGGFKDFFQNVLAVAGKDESVEVTLAELPPELNPYYVKPLPPPKWYQKKWVWGVVAGVAALLAAGAVIAAVLAQPSDILKDADQKYCLTSTCLSMPMAPFLGR